MSEPDYLDLPLHRFLDLVAAPQPAPAGGSAIAVCIGLAAGLAAMAARLAGDRLEGAAALADRAEVLRAEVAPLAEADAAAYAEVLRAQRMPGGETASALSKAADVPLRVAEAGAEVASLAARLAAEGNPNLRGDAVAATLLAEAGVRAAGALVELNLRLGQMRDERKARSQELEKVARAAAQQAVAAIRAPGSG